MSDINYTQRSLEGIWVGDCIGNIGQLYFAHDILKALESGMAKFGNQLDKFNKQFQYSDDTEEAIVLYNHLMESRGRIPLIDQDKLALEFATRYWERDPDGEIYGYGLNTRKVLKDIYEGVPWQEANKIIPKSEGMPSHVDSLVDSLAQGKDFKESMHTLNATLRKEVEERARIKREKQGSCGNGSAMRVGVLGAYLGSLNADDKRIIAEAALQAEVTHCHAEGIAGSIAITKLASMFTKPLPELSKCYEALLKCVPQGQVRDGISKASTLPLNLPLGKVIETLGNGTHVTCQDTVPLCCYLAIKAVNTYQESEIYEKSIIETSMAFGDVDTNCAIVGGIVAIVNPPPEKWKKFCTPMDEIVDLTFVEDGDGEWVSEEIIDELIEELEQEVNHA